MMQRLLPLVLLYLSVVAGAQNLPVGKRTISFTDASRSARIVPTELYYPAAASGTNTPLASGTEKYPVVVFGHGFLMNPSAYVWLADSLVKYGFIVALPSTETGFSPSHEQFGRDLAFLAQRIPSLNDSTGNFLFGRVLGRSAIGGHSMGGGCSLLALTYNTQVQAVFNFAAAETTPSAKSAASNIQKPALLFSGSLDCIVAPAEQQSMYNNIPYPCKSYVNITGGLHCHFGNNDATCALGQVTSGCNNSSVTTSMVFEKTIKLLRPFLQHYLKADCAAAVQYEANFNGITGANTLRTCTGDPLGCVITALPPSANDALLRIFPNPAAASAGMLLKLERGSIERVELLDGSGRSIRTWFKPNTNFLHIGVPGSGIFFARVQTSMGIFYRRIVFHND